MQIGGVLLAKSKAKKGAAKLRNMSTEDVLAAHRMNFQIPLSSVQKAERTIPKWSRSESCGSRRIPRRMSSSSRTRKPTASTQKSFGQP